MESERLSYILKNTYIPASKVARTAEIPDYHPCLVLQDKHEETCKLRPCGCSNDHCIKNAKDWIPRPKH